jgi:hypothetical protein
MEAASGRGDRSPLPHNFKAPPPCIRARSTGLQLDQLDVAELKRTLEELQQNAAACDACAVAAAEASAKAAADAQKQRDAIAKAAAEVAAAETKARNRPEPAQVKAPPPEPKKARMEEPPPKATQPTPF